MKIALILFAVFALAAAASVPEEYLDLNFDVSNRDLPRKDIQGRSLSSRLEDKVRKAISQFSTGWPEAGIPPLAPYLRKEFSLELKKAFAEISVKFEDLLIEGLDNVLINKLTVTYVLSQNIKYNFTFPEIKISGNYMTDSLLKLMEEYGISARVYGKGDFELTLENISFQGYFKYDFPLIVGSICMHDFDGTMSLGNIHTRINGLLGDKFNQLVNDNIEKFVLQYVRENQDEIRTMTEEFVIPIINTEFDGKNIWSFFG